MESREGMLAVLFADVSGSTRLFAALGDVAAHRVVELCLETVRASTLQYAGRVIKAIGDELLCIFPLADAAIAAASDIETRLDAMRRTEPATPFVRIGVAYGPVLEDGSDVFGDTVNLAARIAALATAGQVLTNQATADALTPLLRTCCRPLYSIELKGIEHKVAVHEVTWERNADLTLVTASAHAPAGPLPSPVMLRLSYRGTDMTIAHDQAELRVGRDAQCDLVVATPMTSRRHARLRLHDSNFVLIDESANGTFVRFDGQAEVYLRHEDTVLIGQGVIGFGESTLKESAATVAFTVTGV